LKTSGRTHRGSCLERRFFTRTGFAPSLFLAFVTPGGIALGAASAEAAIVVSQEVACRLPAIARRAGTALV
jgi:hypothetical protein